MAQGLPASRRSILLGGVAWTVLLAAGSWRLAAAPVSFERFMSLSRRLTGRQQLDPKVGKVFFDALVQSEDPAVVLARLLSAEMADDPQAAALEEEIALQWFTGVYRRDGLQKTATYQGALMWQAMAVRGAPGACQGALGCWSRPPAR
jgi:fructose 5-dehydrogenase small subunit